MTSKRRIIILVVSLALLIPTTAMAASVHFHRCGSPVSVIVHNLTCSQGRNVASKAAQAAAFGRIGPHRKWFYHGFSCIDARGPRIPGAKSTWPLQNYDYYCSHQTESLWFAFT